MPDSLVALRTALADAWLGDTHAARAIFGSGEAAKVFDQRLIDLLVGLGVAPTLDANSIYGADLAGLMREIHPTSQADRLAFIQAIKVIADGYEPPVTAAYSLAGDLKFHGNVPGGGQVVATVPLAGYISISRISRVRAEFSIRFEIAPTPIPNNTIYAISTDVEIGAAVSAEFGDAADAALLRDTFHAGLGQALNGSKLPCVGHAFIDESLNAHPSCGYTPFSFVGISQGSGTRSISLSMENSKGAGPYLDAQGEWTSHPYLPTAFSFSGIISV